jgi:hypothetical protein
MAGFLDSWAVHSPAVRSIRRPPHGVFLANDPLARFAASISARSSSGVGHCGCRLALLENTGSAAGRHPGS